MTDTQKNPSILLNDTLTSLSVGAVTSVISTIKLLSEVLVINSYLSFLKVYLHLLSWAGHTALAGPLCLHSYNGRDGMVTSPQVPVTSASSDECHSFLLSPEQLFPTIWATKLPTKQSRIHDHKSGFWEFTDCKTVLFPSFIWSRQPKINLAR